MSFSFQSPNVESLASVDSAAGVQYEDRLTIIDGIVSPSSQGGWGGQRGVYEVHNFTFADWRPHGKPLVGSTLTLLRPVPSSVTGHGFGDGSEFDKFPSYTLQRFEVLLSVDHTRAVICRTLAMDSLDESLLRIAEELQKPVAITTKRFGEIVLDRRLDWFEGKARWNESIIDIRLESRGENSIEEVIKIAESLFSNEADWKKKVAAYAVEKLLPLKNEHWLDDDIAAITSNDFLERMTLTTISIASDGHFDFWHDDGDLFWGHSIQIRGNLKDGLTSADIPG